MSVLTPPNLLSINRVTNFILSINLSSFNKDIATPKIAILLAIFNGVQYLQEQLESILNQEHVAVEVFVSVDASSDGSEQWIEEKALSDARIHVLSHGQRFGGAAPNFFRLIREVNFSSFDYVSLADQDDIWLPQKLSAGIEMLKKSKADAYSSNALAFWADGKEALIDKAQAQVKWDYLFEAAGPGCTYILTQRLALALQVILLNKSKDSQAIGLHDWFIYAFARANGYLWAIDHATWIRYRQHAKNQVGVNSGIKAFMHRAHKVTSGWALSQSILIAQLIGSGNTPFVKSWSSGKPLALLKLASHSWQCRRRLKDKVLFFFSCLLMAAKGGISK